MGLYRECKEKAKEIAERVECRNKELSGGGGELGNTKTECRNSERKV